MYSSEEVKKAALAISIIAKHHGVSEEQVRKDLTETMNYALANTAPSAIEQVQSFSYSGTTPTVEEFIVWLLIKTKIALRDKAKEAAQC